MPTPDRTSRAAIVEAAREILESAGFAGLTMQAVADRVGVRAPSLYKRVRNRDDLVRLITEATVRDLGERLATIGAGTNPRRDLAELARAIRAFARARPMGYQLISAPRPGLAGPSIEEMAHAIEPVLQVAGNLAGEHHALQAARTFIAWASGFINMELAGGFKLGGDIDQAYEFGIAHLIDALGGQPPD